jgi:hypothetical protein
MQVCLSLSEMAAGETWGLYFQLLVRSLILFISLLYEELCNLCLLPYIIDRLCDLVVRVRGYRSGGPGSIPGTTRKK